MVETTAGPITILPNEGIGVFVHSLVGGLMAQREPVEVVLVVHPRDHDQVASYHGPHASRVRVLSRPRENPPVRQRLGIPRHLGQLLRSLLFLVARRAGAAGSGLRGRARSSERMCRAAAADPG